MIYTDEILWEGLRNGDKELFLSLYKKYYHCLLFIGLKEMKDAHVVKDAIQQLFLYLWEKRETIQAAKNIKSYLITSFLRKLSTDWKKSKKTGELQLVWNSTLEDPQLNPEDKLIKKDEQSHLSKLLLERINELPNRQKELIILRFYEGLSYDEIVQHTGLSHRTVYNKIHEGIKVLKLEMASGDYAQRAALMLLLSLLTTATACFTASN